MSLINIVLLLDFLNFVVRARRKSPGLKLAVSVLTCLISIQKVPSSNLGWGLVVMTRISHGFPLSFWQKLSIVPENGSHVLCALICNHPSV
jgi:hypothetical protein